MTVITAPQCYNCKHFNPGSIIGLTCNAYPKGIPEEILSGEHDHRQPFKGDNGIMFELLNDTKPAINV